MSTPITRRRFAARLAVVAVVAGGVGAAGALAASSTNCAVNASAGFVNCLTYSNPNYEQVRALQSSGLPYRFQLRRVSDGATWGWWQWSDLNNHITTLHLTGSIRAQVDNRGTGNPSSYYVEMG